MMNSLEMRWLLLLLLLGVEGQPPPPQLSRPIIDCTGTYQFYNTEDRLGRVNSDPPITVNCGDPLPAWNSQGQDQVTCTGDCGLPSCEGDSACYNLKFTSPGACTFPPRCLGHSACKELSFEGCATVVLRSNKMICQGMYACDSIKGPYPNNAFPCDGGVGGDCYIECGGGYSAVACAQITIAGRGRVHLMDIPDPTNTRSGLQSLFLKTKVVPIDSNNPPACGVPSCSGSGNADFMCNELDLSACGSWFDAMPGVAQRCLGTGACIKTKKVVCNGVTDSTSCCEPATGTFGACKDADNISCVPNFCSPTSSPLGPTNSPSMPSVSPIGPSRHPSTPPSFAPSSPTRSPWGPSRSPSTGPTNSPSSPSSSPLLPSIPPTLSPTLPPSSPSVMPSVSPSDIPSRMPTAPTGPPSNSPTNLPTAPTTSPSARPTSTPSISPHTSIPTAAPTHGPTRADSCPSGLVRRGDVCEMCKAEDVQGGCGAGGVLKADSSGVECMCLCQTYWTGSNCGVCPPKYGGLNCERCNTPGAVTPDCTAPVCGVGRTGILDVECGAVELTVPFAPTLRSSVASFELLISTQGNVSGVSFPPGTNVTRTTGGWVLGGVGVEVVRGASQVGVDLPSPLEEGSTLTMSGTLTGEGCVPVVWQTTIRCSTGGLPPVTAMGPTVTIDRGEVREFECPEDGLLETGGHGGVSYSPAKGLCTVAADNLTTTHNVTVRNKRSTFTFMVAPGNVSCVGTEVKTPFYRPDSVPTVVVEVEGVAALWQRVEGVQLSQVGSSAHVSFEPKVKQRDHYLRVTDTQGCAHFQGIHRFREPLMLPVEGFRVGKGRNFTYSFYPVVHPLVGGPDCDPPSLHLTVAPAGLRLVKEAGKFALVGMLPHGGSTVVGVEATDCRGGTASVTIPVYVVSSTELHPPPPAQYTEDRTGTAVAPIVVSPVDVTMTWGPTKPELAGMVVPGAIAVCPQGVRVLPPGDGVWVRVAGPPEELGKCVVTFRAKPNVCGNIEAEWVAEGGARVEQQLRGTCMPDTPIGRNVSVRLHYEESREVDFDALVEFTDEPCHEYHAKAYVEDMEVSHDLRRVLVRGSARTGLVERCLALYGYACEGREGGMGRLCVESVPDIVLKRSDTFSVNCTEDIPCDIGGALSVLPGLVSNKTTMTIAVGVKGREDLLHSVLTNSSNGTAPSSRQVFGGVELEGTYVMFKHAFEDSGLQLEFKRDFEGEVDLELAGSRVTKTDTVAIRVVVEAVNDAPRCKEEDCGGDQELSCPMFGSSEIDVAQWFYDPDGGVPRLEVVQGSRGVSVSGTKLRCSHFSSLASFFGAESEEQITVVLVDDKGAVSPPFYVNVAYALSTKENNVVTAIATILGFSSGLAGILALRFYIYALGLSPLHQSPSPTSVAGSAPAPIHARLPTTGPLRATKPRRCWGGGFCVDLSQAGFRCWREGNILTAVFAEGTERGCAVVGMALDVTAGKTCIPLALASSDKALAYTLQLTAVQADGTAFPCMRYRGACCCGLKSEMEAKGNAVFVAAHLRLAEVQLKGREECELRWRLVSEEDPLMHGSVTLKANSGVPSFHPVEERSEHELSAYSLQSTAGLEGRIEQVESREKAADERDRVIRERLRVVDERFELLEARLNAPEPESPSSAKQQQQPTESSPLAPPALGSSHTAISKGLRTVATKGNTPGKSSKGRARAESSPGKARDKSPPRPRKPKRAKSSYAAAAAAVSPVVSNPDPPKMPKEHCDSIVPVPRQDSDPPIHPPGIVYSPLKGTRRGKKPVALIFPDL
eukprot:Hpha_TRINITY_DN16737_c3_g1::TRINITY_DN16737_c3_g1_i1::g.80204::m.80204